MRTRELKPGITVRVKPNLKASKEFVFGYPYVNELMLKERGKKFKVTKENYLSNGIDVCNKYRVVKFGWNWTASMLEKV